MGEQPTKEKGLNIGDIIAGLSEISRRIDGDTDEKRPELVFNDNVEKGIKTDLVEENGEEAKLEAGRTDYLSVKVYEDIDIKDVSKGSKFTIRISNRDGFYVDIDMFAYRDIVLDNEKSEEEFIVSKIERIIGINSNIDKAGKTVCDRLSKLCYQKDLQIK